MVYRIYVEKKPGFDGEAQGLLHELVDLVGIKNLTGLRLLNRYDVEGIDSALFQQAIPTVFCEPPVDVTYDTLPEAKTVFAVEYLPGQFDQRADSASQCIQLLSQGERPDVRSARVYLLDGELTADDLAAIKKYVINPVEAREAALEERATLKMEFAIPTEVETLNGFTALDDDALEAFRTEKGLAMDHADIVFCQDYFKSEHRDPTITEIRLIDTYWSDHCRHTTFGTIIDDVKIDDELVQAAFDRYMALRAETGRDKKNRTLMDCATIGAKALKQRGILKNLDESDEINACTVKIKCDVDGEQQDWLFLFKNETHNHPTEIEPFGGAATCIGGAIRDPLSGRSYVYAAMRVTGAGDPLTPAAETVKGKLPQRKIVTTAANGYSSYGNQIGLTTGLVDEIYHPGYVAKRMEVGAVVGAAPAENIRRERPAAGDQIILLGGRTGRDGIGGATGSSKSHSEESLESCGAEVQKGNAPEERKIQRLFRNPAATTLIKRCNDFGAGGVSVAIGELADGLRVTLDNVPKKYDGLDGTELAISESQERMAVVVAAEDVETFKELAISENLEATVVAEVTEEPSLVMNFKGQEIVNISRAFLDTNGAEKKADAVIEHAQKFEKKIPAKFYEGMKELATDLNVCSKRGLAERFDSTIGRGSVLMPYGGRYQKTPIQAMVHKIPVIHRDQDVKTVSMMAYGFNPYISEKSPYHGAYLSIVESICKLIATGAKFEHVYLSLQEYFEKLGSNDVAWGTALSAVLGAFRAQMELGVGAIGGKDSMSGTFEDIHVPPTLISFAVTTEKLDRVVSPEFKGRGHNVILLEPEIGPDGLPTAESILENFAELNQLVEQGAVAACYTPGYGGLAEAVYKMCIGNEIGFEFDQKYGMKDIFGYKYGAFVVELNSGVDVTDDMEILGKTLNRESIVCGEGHIRLVEMNREYESKLESIYTFHSDNEKDIPAEVSYRSRDNSEPRVAVAKPHFLIPVFPGTNCEYDSAKAVENAGGEAEIFVINNLTADTLKKSVEDFRTAIGRSQAIFIPGGFSGADEPDGSGKFITSFFRNEGVKEEVMKMLNDRDGLMIGICNGFQALIKLGLLPYGQISMQTPDSPTLTFNDIGRHQSKLVRTKVCSTKSPWMRKAAVGDIVTVPISHGEGKFVANEDDLDVLISNGQILTQYVDLDGNPSMDIQYNPNGSVMAIEGLLSPDGRILGKMGHSERIGKGLYRNVPGEFDLKLFESAVEYFKK